jgi:hypothetical protein
MLGIDDLIRLPFTADLPESGITYACRSLPHTYNHIDSSSCDYLRRMTASVVVELAFRRYLTQNDVPFEVTSETPFTPPTIMTYRWVGIAVISSHS